MLVMRECERPQGSGAGRTCRVERRSKPPDRRFQAAQTAGQLRTIGAGEHAFAMMLIVANERAR